MLTKLQLFKAFLSICNRKIRVLLTNVCLHFEIVIKYDLFYIFFFGPTNGLIIKQKKNE